MPGRTYHNPEIDAPETAKARRSKPPGLWESRQAKLCLSMISLALCLSMIQLIKPPGLRGIRSSYAVPVHDQLQSMIHETTKARRSKPTGLWESRQAKLCLSMITRDRTYEQPTGTYLLSIFAVVQAQLPSALRVQTTVPGVPLFKIAAALLPKVAVMVVVSVKGAVTTGTPLPGVL